MPEPAYPLIISVEGNIGSGKSTLVRDLQSMLGSSPTLFGRTVMFLQEPVEIWNDTKDRNGESILSKFYADQNKYAFPFQMMAYISRQSSINKAMTEHPNGIIITERCIHTDKHVFAKMLFDDDKIEDINYQIYDMWFDEFSNKSRYAGHVYLEATPDTCASRIVKRGRAGETIPREYLARCNEYHDAWLDDCSNILRLDANRDTDNKENCVSVLSFVEMIANGN